MVAMGTIDLVLFVSSFGPSSRWQFVCAGEASLVCQLLFAANKIKVWRVGAQHVPDWQKWHCRLSFLFTRLPATPTRRYANPNLEGKKAAF
jgi:hypothetical protein